MQELCPLFSSSCVGAVVVTQMGRQRPPAPAVLLCLLWPPRGPYLQMCHLHVLRNLETGLNEQIHP